MKSENKTNFGIVGCGRIAHRHAKYISQYGNLKAVCDIHSDKMIPFVKEYNINSYLNIVDLLENEKDIDVISICSPNGLHAEHTLKSLRAGFHVLVEKPMAISVDDCGKMINESLIANKRLFVVKQNRFNPPIEALKKIIDEGRLGKILNVQLNCFWNRNNEYYLNSDWKGKLSLDGGTLFTQFSHFIDLLYWLIGDIKEAKGFSNNVNHKDIIEFEDNGVVAIKFFNGVIGTINYHVNSFEKNMEGSITLFGEKGTIKVGGQYLNELEYQNIENYRIENLPQGNPPNNYGQYVGSMSNHDKVYENVVNVLNNIGQIATNGFEGLKTVEFIDKIYSKIRRNES